MPKRKVLTKIVNYTKLFDLIEQYKMSLQWWDDRGAWIAGVSVSSEDPRVTNEYKSAQSKMCSIHALTQLLEELGHGDEIWIELEKEDK